MNVLGPKHIILFTVHVWGHTRPMSTLAARLVQLGSITVTFFVAAKLFERVKAEIARDVETDAQHDRLANIQFVVIEQGDNPFDPEVLEQSLMSIWSELLDGRAVTYAAMNGTKAQWELSTLPPDVIVIDIFGAGLFRTFHEQRRSWTLPRPLKIYSWLPVTTSCALVLWRQNVIPIAEAMVAREGMTFDEAAHDLMWTPSGKVITTPCLPPLYDYELHPQAMPLPPKYSGSLFVQIGWMLENTDGAITFDAADYHPTATTAMRDWFGQTSRPFCYAGPLVPPSAGQGCSSPDTTSEPATKFLDDMLARGGKNSVVYVSFGSMLWPSDPAKLDAVLDVLMSRRIPIVMSQPPASTRLLDDTRRKLAEYESAFCTDWIPQQAVLNHPAVGWCLTHGGHNSVLECVLAGVPMIVWPIVMDQPPNAVHLVDNLDVAYELVEVRHGSGLSTIYRTGKTPNGSINAVKAEIGDVLDRAFGKDGEEKRARLKALKTTLEGAWKEDGAARRDALQLLESI
ncbi:hypothetical protein VTO73DRAFT_12099 [Trametes versicolor]